MDPNGKGPLVSILYLQTRDSQMLLDVVEYRKKQSGIQMFDLSTVIH